VHGGGRRDAASERSDGDAVGARRALSGAVRFAKILLVISGAIALAVGFAMMFATRAFLKPQGVTVDGPVTVLGQAQGSILLGLAAIQLFAVRLDDRRALRTVCGGIIVLQLAALAVNIRAYAGGILGATVFADIALHVGLAAAFAVGIRLLGETEGAATAPVRRAPASHA
jgi:hypothetical protein